MEDGVVVLTSSRGSSIANAEVHFSMLPAEQTRQRDGAWHDPVNHKSFVRISVVGIVQCLFCNYLIISVSMQDFMQIAIITKLFNSHILTNINFVITTRRAIGEIDLAIQITLN